MRRRISKAKKSLVNRSLRKKISQYREYHEYDVDIEVEPSSIVNLPSRLPSEPPEGIKYEFGPTGYVINEVTSRYCVVPTEWWGVDNYCHWTFSEVPLLCLAFASDAEIIALPKALLKGKLHFQRRWLEVLQETYPGKKLTGLSRKLDVKKSIVPVNHDTSSSPRMVGACSYSSYHGGRATPFCLKILGTMVPNFDLASTSWGIEKLYIQRRNRVLQNEEVVQRILCSHGFEIIDLEELSLDDQVQMFHSARIVMGFHGAGLANLVFCNQSATILEIVDEDCIHPSYKTGIVLPGKKAPRNYYHLAAHMKGLGYDFIESENYVLDPDKLIKFIGPHL